MSRDKVVRAFTDGMVEEAHTEEGPDGFLMGIFADGTIWHTEIPNVTRGLPSRKSMKDEEDRKRKQKRKKNKLQRQKQRLKQKKKSETKAKAKAKPKAKAKAKAKPKMNIQEDGGPTPSEVEKESLPTEGLEHVAQQDADVVEDQSMHWKHVVHM
jgi:hypothetical protein